MLILTGVDKDAYFNQYTPNDGFKWDGPHQISDGVAGANKDSIFFMDVDGYVTSLREAISVDNARTDRVIYV